MGIEFTAKDFCKIIEKCSVSGVSEMKFAGIHVKFTSSGKFTNTHSAFDPDQGSKQASKANPPQDFNDQAKLPSPQEFERQTQMILEEYEHTQKLINDPLAYEQDFIDGNLRDQCLATETSNN